MRPIWALFLTLLSYQPGLASRPAKRHYSTHDYYVLEHDPAGTSLDAITETLGVEVVEQVGELRHFWLVRAEKPSADITRRETTDRVLEKFSSLRTQATSPSDWHLSHRSVDNHQARSIVSSVKHLSRQALRQRVKRVPLPVPPPTEETPSQAAALRLGITDPLFPQQWHIINDDFPEHMMNVTGVWEMGITGNGVISALVDDGLDYEHKDLAANFVNDFFYEQV